MKRIAKRILIVVLLLGIMVSVTGCYNETVTQNSVGVEFNRGVMTGLKAPGHHSGGVGYTLEHYDGNTKSAKWSSPYVWTSDKQEITMDITVDYARNTTEEGVKKMLRLYSTAAYGAGSDAELERIVLSKIAETVKNTSTTYKIDDMVGLGDTSKNRETLKRGIMESLSSTLASCGIDLIDLMIDNVEPSPEYKAEMQQKSLLLLQQETEAERQALEMAQIERRKQISNAEMDEQIQAATKQLEVITAEQALETAKTELALEIARGENLVAEEQSRIWSSSPEAYELERLRILVGAFSQQDKWFFVQPDLDVTYLLDSASGSVLDAVATE